MPLAARVADMTGHGPPLTPGIGSPNVFIGGMPAWRALPAGVGGAVESVSNAMKSFMGLPMLTPASAAVQIVQIQSGLLQAGGAAAAQGNPAAVGAAASASVTLISTNVALTATWTAASAVPGGQPAANIAYTEGIKAAAAAAASSVFASIAGVTDTHICPIPCPIPPHGPGMVTRGSPTVMINNLAAVRQGDQVFEACGGPDPIAIGCPTVIIGDTGGGGGGAGAPEGTPVAEAAAARAETEDVIQKVEAIENAFSQAAINGLPLVDRSKDCPCKGI